MTMTTLLRHRARRAAIADRQHAAAAVIVLAFATRVQSRRGCRANVQHFRLTLYCPCTSRRCREFLGPRADDGAVVDGSRLLWCQWWWFQMTRLIKLQTRYPRIERRTNCHTEMFVFECAGDDPIRGRRDAGVRSAHGAHASDLFSDDVHTFQNPSFSLCRHTLVDSL